MKRHCIDHCFIDAGFNGEVEKSRQRAITAARSSLKRRKLAVSL